MYIIETDRMIGYSDILVENGMLKNNSQHNSSIDIFSIKSTGRESCFLFYDKNNKDTLICHIGIVWHRERTEVSYGTEESFRRNGYMQEALNAFLIWASKYTIEKSIWGIPNGKESQHILEKCGFKYYEKVSNTSSSYWFVFDTATYRKN